MTDTSRALSATDKHGNHFTVYQVVRPIEPWLATEPPSRFQAPAKPAAPLPAYVAHFIANGVACREFLLALPREPAFHSHATILLHLLTLDSLENSTKSPLERPYYRVQRSPDGSLGPTWRAIVTCTYWVVAELAGSIRDRLASYPDCFERGDHLPLLGFPSQRGAQRAQAEHPTAWSFVVKEGETSTGSGSDG